MKKYEFDVALGDCLEILGGMADNSIDAIVTDPPAGISFLGREWDSDKGGRDKWIAWLQERMVECLRVLKPGGHAFIWAIPRTSHWTATAVENAGFEIRDVVNHIFGSGFPKSMDVSKAIDKAAGVEREVLGVESTVPGRNPENWVKTKEHKEGSSHPGSGYEPIREITEPATDEAKRWEGWGTALKPASEHWILVRKPLTLTVAENVVEHGTGALNIEDCRAATDDNLNGGAYAQNGTERDDGWGMQRTGGAGEYEQPSGRWPANVVLSHGQDCSEDECAEGCPVAEMDEQSGTLTSGKPVGFRTEGGTMLQGGGNQNPMTGFGDEGGASRFFNIFEAEQIRDRFLYCSKPSGEERNRGLKKPARTDAPRLFGGDDDTPEVNDHPTVKALGLMRWLCRLITPEGGIVLDPFCGSGSTGVAAIEEGFAFIGIDDNPKYVTIAEARLKDARKEMINNRFK